MVPGGQKVWKDGRNGRTNAQMTPKLYPSDLVRDKKLHFDSLNWRKEISSAACGFSPIKIHFSDDPKSLISRINEVYLAIFY